MANRKIWSILENIANQERARALQFKFDNRRTFPFLIARDRSIADNRRMKIAAMINQCKPTL
jgi:hypothetical protein